MSEVPYVSGVRTGIPTPDELRARIPGWGADRDPADRPSDPQELAVGTQTPVLHRPQDQLDDRPGGRSRERSIEHARLTPVFGATVPLRGLSGVLRRRAYARYSEARAAHWLLLLGADRVDAVELAVVAFVSGRPDNPVTESGVVGELRGDGLRSRLAPGRVDVGHHVADPVIVALPWLTAGWGVLRLLRAGRRLVTGRAPVA